MVTGVYLHAAPGATSLKEVFYVGKGTPHRSRSFTDARNPHYRNKVTKFGVSNKYNKKDITVLYLACPSEPIAFALEIELIRYLRDIGAKLVNLTDGGEGCGSGDEHWTAKEPEKVKRGAAHKNFGKKRSVQAIKNMSLSKMGQKAWNKGIHDMKWMNDETNSRMIRSKDWQKFLDDGWIFGRVKWSEKHYHMVA